LNNTGAGTTILSNANTYSGGTTVAAGKLYAEGGVANTSSATGTGAISVSSGATLAGAGVIRPTVAAAGITLASGSTLYSGDVPTGTAAGNGLTMDNTVAQGTILDASLGNVTLVFNLGTGTDGLTGSTVGQHPLDFANPNVGSSFIKVLDSGGPGSVGELKFATGDTIQINDLTGGHLQLNQGIPYLLIQAIMSAFASTSSTAISKWYRSRAPGR
jgi:fibronectin-binding autotransporter adhesin